MATRGRIMLLDRDKRSIILHLCRFPVRTLAVSQDPSILLVGDSDGTVILFRGEAPDDRRSIDLVTSRAVIVRFLNSGKTIVVCSGRQRSALYDAA